MPIDIKHNCVFRVYREENNGNGNDLGGSAPPPPPPANDNPAPPNNSAELEKEKSKLLKEVMTKKEQINQLQNQTKELQEQLSKFDGIDPDAVRAMLAKQKADEQAELERKGEYDRLKAQMIQAHDKEKAELVDKLKAGAEAVSAMQLQIAELTVGNAFANSSYVQNDTILTPSKARKFYGDYFEFADGKVVGYDKPAGSKERTVLVDAVGEPLSFDEALKKVMDADPDKDIFLRSKAKQGAGSRTEKKTQSTAPIFYDRQEKVMAGLAQMAKTK